jgi:hypothetical protein
VTRKQGFDIMVDGEKVATQILLMNKQGRFIDAIYPLPELLTKAKNNVTVEFQACPAKVAGDVFSVKVVKHESG